MCMVYLTKSTPYTVQAQSATKFPVIIVPWSEPRQSHNVAFANETTVCTVYRSSVHDLVVQPILFVRFPAGVGIYCTVLQFSIEHV